MKCSRVLALLAVSALASVGSRCPAHASSSDRTLLFESAAVRPSSSSMCATRTTLPPIEAPDAATIQRGIQEGRIAVGGVVPVHFHVIEANFGYGTLGIVDEAQLDLMISVLNSTFAGKGYNGVPVPGAAVTGYTFYKASVDYTLNNDWYGMALGSRAERDAKAALAIDPNGSLNFYTCGIGASGWATFPWDLRRNGAQDGVVVGFVSLPGSTYLGGIPVHEVGHWVGLYHTFQGGCHLDKFCDTKGDRVCDTPAEASPASGCPVGRNTCDDGVGLDGPDPIHNYMDYSGDACYDNFTPGQDARMDFMMAQNRPSIGSARIAGATGVVSGKKAPLLSDPRLRAYSDAASLRVRIEFTLSRGGPVSLLLFDVAGRLVATVPSREYGPGNYSETLDAKHLPSGAYWIQLRAEGAPVVRKVIILK